MREKVRGLEKSVILKAGAKQDNSPPRGIDNSLDRIFLGGSVIYDINDP